MVGVGAARGSAGTRALEATVEADCGCVGVEIVIGGPALPGEWLRADCCAETARWRAGAVGAAAMRSGRGHRVPNSAFAVRPPASGNADDAGNRPSAPATPTIATTRPARSGRGRRATVTTGPNTGSGIQPTATAIVTPPGSGSVSAVARGCLQRWTRRGAKRQCLQALTGSRPAAPGGVRKRGRGG